MKQLIVVLAAALFAGPAAAKDSVSALDSLSGLVGGQAAAPAPAPPLKAAPVLKDGDKTFSRFSNPVMEACDGERSCFMALDGPERGLCEAYKEGKSCFMALDGANRGWCEVLKEGSSCFMALEGEDRDRCQRGGFPHKHLFWARCGNVSLPHQGYNPVMEACNGERSCFMALDGLERGLCEAYKEDKSCFMALDGADRGWCEVLKEGNSCFMALDGADRDRCQRGSFPGRHLFWNRCSR